MHIHMSFCTPSAFKVLASNYLEIKDHTLFRKIEELIGKVEFTPAMVTEEFMRNGNPEVALQGLLEFLQNKKRGKVKKQRSLTPKNGEPDHEEVGEDYHPSIHIIDMPWSTAKIFLVNHDYNILRSISTVIAIVLLPERFLFHSSLQTRVVVLRRKPCDCDFGIHRLLLSLS
ncbi:hypothetical protein NE237_004217 [Protea cynaroides]|uniref:AAA+ ATPase At3g28540-like C-terminal domain-containing protein n=1 Tax=Protea cynaroides TaxID=273540 RepID=A0A9Q0KI95_9MAGN|nr:hypothetical protein NE237_004217 [Protea cynaroides]